MELAVRASEPGGRASEPDGWASGVGRGGTKSEKRKEKNVVVP